MSLPELKYESVKIKNPYNGKVYNFRPILVKDINNELEVEDNNKPQVLNAVCKIIEKCYLGDVSELDNLYFHEICYLYLQLKAESDDTDIECLFRCMEHDVEFKTTINLTDVRVPDDIENIKKLQIEVGDITLYFDYHKFKDIKNIDDELDKVLNYDMFKGYIENGQYNSLDETTITEKKEFIENLPPKAVKRFNKFIDDTPNPFIAYKNECPKCDNEEERYIKEIIDFFI